jgi:hypothetical protein
MRNIKKLVGKFKNLGRLKMEKKRIVLFDVDGVITPARKVSN